MPCRIAVFSSKDTLACSSRSRTAKADSSSASPGCCSGLVQTGQVVLRYVDAAGNPTGYPGNPSGSQEGVAGICDATGRVLGVMPHPERHVLPTQHPQWTRLGLAPEGDGLRLFRNAVECFQ